MKTFVAAFAGCILALALAGGAYWAHSAQKEKEEQCRINLMRALVVSGINGSLDRFRLDMGRYPTTQEGLAALFATPRADDAKNWAGPYLKNPADIKDRWGRDLVYRCPGEYNADSYDLSSVGPDGLIGTGDDVTNWEG